MAIRKSELYSSLWKSCDELRGGMDASQYKDYVLVLLFMKYVSDKARSQPNYLLDVPAGGSFADMVALKGNPDIGDKLNKIIARLAEANDLKGVIDVADFNDPDKLGRGKEMVDRLSNLVGIFDNPALDFSANRADGDDLLGDAYEYLMRHFATESGKSKGQFYTPAEVSRIMAKVVGLGGARSADQSIYDPTCGSGSLLLKAHDEAKTRTGFDLAIYGQEMDNATAALARMNMILHDAPTAEITPGGSSTLANPLFLAKDGSLKTFDWVVANPPFSSKNWRNGFNPEDDLHKRFPYGQPPARNGDYAFLLHILASLKSTGKGACILPHGVLFRGGGEGLIRREIVRRGYIKGIVGLPANLFYGTGIAACIVVLDKEGSADRRGVFLLDASRGFAKDGAKNRLRAQDIHKIVDTFTRQAEIPGYSRMVPLATIEGNDFNLNLSRYIDSLDAVDVQDIDAHLRGGIPQRDIEVLDRYWTVMPTLRENLIGDGPRPGYCSIRVAPDSVKDTIVEHPEFDLLAKTVVSLMDDWSSEVRPRLTGLSPDDVPKDLGEELSESILRRFARAQLLDPYDVYQRFMEYWASVMQDDVYLVVETGWKAAAAPRLMVDTRDQKSKEVPDYTVGKQRFKSDLIPASLLVALNFQTDRDALELLREAVSLAEIRLDDMAQEHATEGGILEGALDEKSNLTKRSVESRLRQVRREPDAADERAALEQYRDLLDKVAATKRRLKATSADLNEKVARAYAQLTDEDIAFIVVSEKWLASLAGDVYLELDRVSQMLASRLVELTERYAVTLPELAKASDELAGLVRRHLERMGATWQ